jgi:hypothetical protein
VLGVLGVLGVDLGLGTVNLATESEGATCSALQVPIVRPRYHLRRQRLRQVNTKKMPSAASARPRGEGVASTRT